MLIDTHAHIDSNNYENILEVINNAKTDNVLKIINCALDVFTCEKVLEISRKYKNIVYPSLGFHPGNLDDLLEDDIKTLEKYIKNNKIIAIGEIGLDYYYGKNNREKQITFFKKQLQLAHKYNLPVIVHSRESTLDTLNTLKEYNVKGVIHCFNGSLETAKEYIKMGFYLGIGGLITFKNSKLKEVIKYIPLEYLLLETDCPYMTPEPYRKFKNEPKYIKVVAEYIAELKSVSVEEVEKITTNNAFKIFDF